VKDAPLSEPALHKSDQAAALELVHHVAQAWQRHLDQRLVGIYLVGSLAHGGYSGRYSDIDVALIAEGLLDFSELDRVNREAATHSAPLAARLSVFWTNSGFLSGRFPPLDRIDYLDHAVPVLERRHVIPARPTLSEIRAYLRAEPFKSWSEAVLRFNSLEELAVEDHKRYLRALLYPARFLYSWETGNVASNDHAVAYLEERKLVGSELDIIARALRCRIDGGDPSPLFSERTRLLRLLDICAERVTQRG